MLILGDYLLSGGFVSLTMKPLSEIISPSLAHAAEALLTSLNKRPPAPAAKSKLNKEILILAPTAVPGFESKGEVTKITKTKLEDKPDHLKVLKKHGKGK